MVTAVQLFQERLPRESVHTQTERNCGFSKLKYNYYKHWKTSFEKTVFLRGRVH